jgi:solute carrier family 25 phosphate transporter 23/24/25/41
MVVDTLTPGGVFRELCSAYTPGYADALTFCGGGVAGVVGKSAVAPLSRICILMQLQSMHEPHGKTPPKTLMTAFGKVVEEEGPRALWRGNTAMVLHRLPYSGVMFMTHERLKELFQTYSKPYPAQSATFIASAAASFTAVSVTYPLDVVRTRHTAETAGKVLYGSIRKCFEEIPKEEGWMAFYKGWRLTVFFGNPLYGVEFHRVRIHA